MRLEPAVYDLHLFDHSLERKDLFSLVSAVGKTSAFHRATFLNLILSNIHLFLLFYITDFYSLEYGLFFSTRFV